MGTWPQSKEGGRAINVGNEPGGEGRALAQGPDAEANRLVDGGRRSVRHAGAQGCPKNVRTRGDGPVSFRS
eukprot:9640442-Alexandrium_andersonii.AAC.1